MVIRIKGRPNASGDSLGRFEVTGLPVGTLQLTLLALGYAGDQFRVTIAADKVTESRFGLDFSGESLPDVVVTARATKLVPRYTDFETRRERGC